MPRQVPKTHKKFHPIFVVLKYISDACDKGFSTGVGSAEPNSYIKLFRQTAAGQ